MNLKTEARRAAILTYIELNPDCNKNDISVCWKITPKTVEGYLRELKEENQIKADESSKTHTYCRLCDDNETIARFVEAKKFFETQRSNVGFNEYLDAMRGILNSKLSLAYYVKLHYETYADEPERLTSKNLIGMPYSEKESGQDYIIKEYLSAYSSLIKTAKEIIETKDKVLWVQKIKEVLPLINARPATLIPFAQAASQFLAGNQQPLMEFLHEWADVEFTQEQHVIFTRGIFQYYVNKHRELGRNVAPFEDLFNKELGFFTYSPKHLLALAEKMNDSFEKDVDLMDFFLEMGKVISSTKIDADLVIAQLTEKMPSGDKLQMFKKYKIHCLKNCFMSEDELWVEFSNTYRETLNRINLNSQETFVREFNRWNEWSDLDEFKQKVQILNMKGNRLLAY